VPLVLAAAPTAAPGVYEIKVKGTATINGQTVVREARYASITWPTQPGQNVQSISRLDRKLVIGVREPDPYRVDLTLDKPALLQGEKANLTVKLARHLPDYKGQIQALGMDLPQNQLTVNNNGPMNLAADKNEFQFPVEARANLPPGTYTIVLRTTAQVPFNKDPMAKQKPNINVVLPSSAVQITVLPKQVANLSLPNANVTAKIGNQAEVVVKLARMYDYAGEFKVELLLPPNAKGVSADPVTVPAGKDEAKIIVRIAADAAPVNLQNLVVKAMAMVNGNLPTVHEAKVNVNVVK